MNKWIQLIIVNLILLGIFTFVSLNVELSGAGLMTAILVVSFSAQYAFYYLFEKDKD